MDAFARLIDRVKLAYEPNPDPAAVRAADDRTILGDLLQPDDRNAPYLQGRDYYAWYWALGHAAAPRVIVELGVRYGYSLAALAAGARAALGPNVRLRLYGFDNESCNAGSCAIAQAGLSRRFPDDEVVITKVDDLYVLPALEIPGRADLVHADARHDYAGCRDDLRLAQGVIAPGGVILVDDYNCHEEIRRACREVNAPGGRTVIMHHHGLGVLCM